MTTRVQDVIQRGDALFTKKQPILSLWQAITEQFYPEHADYTYQRSMGMEFASHLMTGEPAMANRDLANAISSMLRPPGQVWAHPRTQSARINSDTDALRWLDWSGDQMRTAMYHVGSGFTRATKEGDRDYSSIGNVCMEIRPNRMMNGLLYKTFHMRDVAWAENDAGNVDEIHAKRRFSARNLVKKFPDTVDPKVKTAADKDPFTEFMCRRVVMPADQYDSDKAREMQAPAGERRRIGHNLPFVSLWVDVDNQTMLEEIGQWDLGFCPPRWETVPQFGYGYSPSSTINISDARMLQQITLTLLEAGQKAVDPPMKAVGEMIQGGVNLFAGGITWVDSDYDEKTGKILEPLMGTMPNLGWGVDREKRIADIITRGHFLNQIRLPDTSHARTAFEVQKLWEEFIRMNTPLFEPLQAEYNGALCQQSFGILLRMNAFGSVYDMPKMLRGQEIQFTFDSPLTLAGQRANAQAYTQVGQLLQLGMAIDPTVKNDIDNDAAFRDAVIGSGAPSSWIVPKAKADKQKALDRAQAAQQQQTDGAIQQAGAAGDAGARIGQAANLLNQGGILGPQAVQPGGAV